MQDDRSEKHIVGHVRDLWDADPRGPNSSLAPCFFLFCSHPDRASHCPWNHSPFDLGQDGLDYSRSVVSMSRLVCGIPNPCPCPCLCPCRGRDPSLSCGRLWVHSLGTPSHDGHHENRRCKCPRNVGGEATFAHWQHNAGGSRVRGRVYLGPCLCRPVDAGSTGLAMRARDHSDAARRLARPMRSLSSGTRVWRGDLTCR